jgi:hypothetical protein
MMVLRIAIVLSNNDEIVRHVTVNAFENVCAEISSCCQEICSRENTAIRQVTVQSQDTDNIFSEKQLAVVNICGKITHTAASQVHNPGIKPYIKKEVNNFGTTDSVYTRFGNFHTGSSNSCTLIRGATCSQEIKLGIEHVFIQDCVQDVTATNIVYNARLGRAVSAYNNGIKRAITQLNIGTVSECLPLEECMFIHCFKVQILDIALLRNMGCSHLTNKTSVRINICRTGVVNFFVGLAGGVLISSAPEKLVFSVCQMLLESIKGAT